MAESTHSFSGHEAAARLRFDDWSASATFQRLRPWLAYVQGKVLKQIDWQGATRVLDVDCGSGWAVFEAARHLQRHNGGMACGCDISIGMLAERATEGQQPGGARFLAASAQALPYRSHTFDVIICTAAFHHFPLPLGALREFRRVLRSGGLVLIADTCRDQSTGTWIWDRMHRWFEPGHVKYYRTDELRRLLTKAGFKSLSLKDLRPTYRQTKKLVRRAALFHAVSP